MIYKKNNTKKMPAFPNEMQAFNKLKVLLKKEHMFTMLCAIFSDYDFIQGCCLHNLDILLWILD